MDLINGIFPSYQNIDIINIEILILINRKNKFPLIFCSAKIPEKNCNSGGSLQTQYEKPTPLNTPQFIERLFLPLKSAV